MCTVHLMIIIVTQIVWVIIKYYMTYMFLCLPKILSILYMFFVALPDKQLDIKSQLKKIKKKIFFSYRLLCFYCVPQYFCVNVFLGCVWSWAKYWLKKTITAKSFIALLQTSFRGKMCWSFTVVTKCIILLNIILMYAFEGCEIQSLLTKTQ